MIDKHYNCYNGKAKYFNPVAAILLTQRFGNVLHRLEPEDFTSDMVSPPEFDVTHEYEKTYYPICEN